MYKKPGFGCKNVLKQWRSIGSCRQHVLILWEGEGTLFTLSFGVGNMFPFLLCGRGAILAKRGSNSRSAPRSKAVDTPLTESKIYDQFICTSLWGPFSMFAAGPSHHTSTPMRRKSRTTKESFLDISKQGTTFDVLLVLVWFSTWKTAVTCVVKKYLFFECFSFQNIFRNSYEFICTPKTKMAFEVREWFFFSINNKRNAWSLGSDPCNEGDGSRGRGENDTLALRSTPGAWFSWRETIEVSQHINTNGIRQSHPLPPPSLAFFWNTSTPGWTPCVLENIERGTNPSRQIQVMGVLTVRAWKE